MAAAEIVCNQEIGCPALVHKRECPWHPENVEDLRISTRDMERLLAEMDAPPRLMPRLTKLLHENEFAITPQEEKDIEKLVELRKAPISMINTGIALFLKYPLVRWQRVLEEAGRRVEEKE